MLRILKRERDKGGSAIRAGGIPRVRIVLLASAVAVLVAIVGFAMQQEASRGVAQQSAQRVARACVASYFCGRRVGATEPVGLTAEEEEYAGALWTVHSAAKVWAIDLSFAGILYKIETQDADKLGAKVRALSGNFASAEARARAIAVPTSMQTVHDKYLGAIQLYESAAAEMLRAAQDGDDRHLLAAQGMSQHASEEMLRVGDVLWPGEYKPN
jgi:hypothetical protein